MEAIRIWFNGKRNYKTGVKLYTIYGSDLLLKRSFLEPETEFKRKRLEEELEKLIRPATPGRAASAAPVGKPVIRVQLQPAPQTPQDSVKKYLWSENPDDVERSIHGRWKPLFVEMMDLVSRVGETSRSGEQFPGMAAEAGRMALRILDLDDQLEDIYAERKHYLEHGRLMEKHPYGEPCLDPTLIPAKLQNHQRYLREQKGKLEKNPDNTETALLVKKHEWFVTYYKKALQK